MAFLKPQSPLSQGNDYFYPLTTADQVIMKGGYRLDQIVGAVKKSTITLYANGWSAEVPYSYSVTVEGLDDNVNMKMLPHFPEDFEGKQAMKEETVKISFASRSGNILTFECWDEVPTIDIPVDIEIDITYPGVPDIKMNYSVVGGIEEPANPTENMIWVNTDQEITDYKLSKYEPKNPIEGMIWIYLSNTSDIYFHTLNINGKEFDEVYPLSAKQYVSGAWISKNAKSYQSDEWVQWWNGELYYSGNEFENITGGWIGDTRAYTSNNGTVPIITRGNTRITAKHDTNQKTGTFRTSKAVDLTGVKNITATGEFYNATGSDGNISLNVWSDIGNNYQEHRVATVQVPLLTKVNELTVDVSDLQSGLYYVGFIIYSGASTSTSGADTFVGMDSCILIK